MDVEAFSNVDQMDSPIKGKLRQDCGAVEAFEAAFPGGSMTGAPKMRTMEIIKELEGEPRGIYAGSIGYFGLNGSADSNIVIRTAVFEERTGL